MSDNFKHTAGLQNVGSYQVSGKPFVTASTVTDGAEQQIEFPEVSNNITVKLDSSAGSGTNYNSLRLSGSVIVKTEDIIFSTDDNEYTWSLWFSGSEEFVTTPQAVNTLNIVGFGHNSFGGAVALHQDAGKRIQFTYNTLTDGTGGTFSQIRTGVCPKGWIFIVAGVRKLSATSVSGYIKIYYDHTYADNNTISQTGIENGNYYYYKATTIFGSVGATFVDINNYSAGAENEAKIGSRIAWGASVQIEDRFYRDVILWNGDVSSDTATLYNNGDYYDFSNYTAVDKLAWFKPDNLSLGSIESGATVTNFGISGSNWENNSAAFDVGEIVNISGEAPFADVAGSGGELRVHFRSTGSLPNVATNKHYWTLDSQNESITMNVKSKELYLSADGGDCDYSVEAELTNIPSSRMFQHTGSGVDE